MLRFLRFWAFGTGDPTNADLGRANAPPGVMACKTSLRLRSLAKGFKGGLSGLVAVGAGSEAT